MPRGATKHTTNRPDVRYRFTYVPQLRPINHYVAKLLGFIKIVVGRKPRRLTEMTVEKTPEELEAELKAKELEESGKGDPDKEESKTPEGAEKPAEKIPYERFKAKVDEANELKAKLKAFEDAQEAQRLSELSELDKEREEKAKLVEELSQIRVDALTSRKQALLIKAGYNDEQIERYAKFVTGEDDEAIAKSVEELVADVPPKVAKSYADPAQSGGGARQTPQPKDLHDKGVSAFQRLKGLGRI